MSVPAYMAGISLTSVGKCCTPVIDTLIRPAYTRAVPSGYVPWLSRHAVPAAKRGCTGIVTDHWAKPAILLRNAQQKKTADISQGVSRIASTRWLSHCVIVRSGRAGMDAQAPPHGPDYAWTSGGSNGVA
jgi:hypothetical protein